MLEFNSFKSFLKFINAMQEQGAAVQFIAHDEEKGTYIAVHSDGTTQVCTSEAEAEDFLKTEKF